MTSISQALALYDVASQIERLRLQLRALPSAPTVPSLTELSSQVHTLAGITATVSEEINRRLSGHRPVEELRTVERYSDILAPLGEAMTELGRAQAAVAFFEVNTKVMQSNSMWNGIHPIQQPCEIVTGCLDAADEILGAATSELQAAATKMAPPQARGQANVHALSSPNPGSGQPHPTPVTSTPPTAPSRAAKGR